MGMVTNALKELKDIELRLKEYSIRKKQLTLELSKEPESVSFSGATVQDWNYNKIDEKKLKDKYPDAYEDCLIKKSKKVIIFKGECI
jgi:hypothetical protein